MSDIFPKLKSPLKRRIFWRMENIKENLITDDGELERGTLQTALKRRKNTRISVWRSRGTATPKGTMIFFH